MENEKGNIFIVAIIIVIVAITTGVITWLIATKSQVPVQQQAVKTQPAAPVQQNQSIAPAVPKAEIVSTYANQKYGFSFNYPIDYKIEENNWEKEPQPGGVIYSVSVGNKSIPSFDELNDNIISILVSKIEKGTGNGLDSLAGPNGMDPTSQKDTIIDGQKARIYNNGEVYTVARNGYEYLLEAPGEGADQTTRNNFAKIVASFKFTN